MGEMKSAYEKAMERVERLGRLSPEEMRKRREAEYAPVGRALADRYLGHGHREIFGEEVNKYSGDERDIVTKAAISRLIEVIELGDCELTERATWGVSTLRGDEKSNEVGEKIRDLCREYKQAEQQEYEEGKEEVEGGGRELLQQLGISGDALGEITLEASGTGRGISSPLYSQFSERLNELKRLLP